MNDSSLVVAVADAIEKAQKARPYGLYDYSKHHPSGPPHVVRNELAKAGEPDFIAGFHDSVTARELYNELTREHVAQAAIKAVSDWMQADLLAQMQRFGLR